MSNFDTAKRIIDEFSSSTLERLNKLMDSYPTSEVFDTLIFCYSYEFQGLVTAFSNLRYISYINMYSFIDEFNKKLNEIDESVHQKNGWIYMRKFRV